MARLARFDPHYEGTLEPFTSSEDGRMIIHWEKLKIIWGNDKRYWKLPEDKDKPAILNQVCWLEVTGSVGNTDPANDYEVGFKLEFMTDAFGWSTPIYIMVKRGKKGKFKWRKERLDKKTEYDFTIKLDKDEHNTDRDLYFGMYEVWSGKWKGGLKIKHAFVKQTNTKMNK